MRIRMVAMRLAATLAPRSRGIAELSSRWPVPKLVFLTRQRVQLPEPAGLAVLETHSQSPLMTAGPG
jgi:hypothetical protein